MHARPVPLFLAASLLIILATARGAAAPPDISGEWDLVIELAGQAREYKLDLKQTGEVVRGELVSPRSKNHYPLKEGTFKDSLLKIDIPRNFEGQEVILKVQAKLAGERAEKLDGTYEVEGLGSGKFTATRKSPPAQPPAPKAPPSSTAPPPSRAPAEKKVSLLGKWRTVAKLREDRDISSLLEVTEREGKLNAVSSSDRGSLEMKSVTLGGDGAVAFGFVLPTNSGDQEFVIKASFAGPDRLKGSWSRADGSISGDWSAEREAPPPPAAAAAAGPLKARYQVQATLPEGRTVQFDLRPKVEGEKVGGVLVTDSGKTIEIRSGSFKDGRLAFEVEMAREGDVRKVKISAVLGERGVLKGTWAGDDSSGEWSGRPVEDL
jgi:hypothetical protein